MKARYAHILALALLCTPACNDNGLASGGPDIEVAPGELHFGVPVPGQPTSRVVTVSNVGGKLLNVTGLAITAESDPVFVALPEIAGSFPVTLGPNEWITVQVSIDAPEPLVYTGTLVVVSDDVDEPESFVDLVSAEPGPDPIPDIEVTPTQHNFGDVERQTCDVRSVQVSNVGTGDLDVTGMNFVIFGFVNDYSASPDQFTLAPGASQNVALNFCPQQTGPQWGDMYIQSNDPDENPVKVNLLGNGVPPPLSATDIHVQVDWGESLTDLDLHFLKPGGAFWNTSSDCHWRALSPDWGAAGPADDPYLDYDDIDGFGPEDLNMIDPATGSYKVVLHYYGYDGSTGDNGPSDTEIRIHLNGSATPTMTFNTTITHHQTWDVAWIHWNATTGTGTIETINTFGTYVP